ncbi:MAG: apolipoprotein N-acyltransferase [Proteobacteria bacterium]|nr:apolipoprotein N-acyltransferase [Pseudomonadota bacterium]
MPSNSSGLPPLLILLLAPVSGALITLSLAPFDVWPAGILSCALLAWMLSTCSPGQAFWRGWLFGLGMFGTGVSWVYVSIHVHGHANIALAGFLTALFCGGLALVLALFAWCYVRLIRALPGGMLIGFPALWVLFEWLRSWLLTGFPWLYLGYAHVDTWISGWAPVIGVYGLSFICALTGSCLFLTWRSREWGSGVTYAVIVVLLWGGGSQLKPIEWVAPAKKEALSVAIYQPNIPQENKWDPSWYQPILAQYEEATQALLGNDIIIWPESAIPRIYQRARDFLDPMAQQAAAAESTLITGIPYRSEDGSAYHNSIIALGDGSGAYHKQRLVPFGEYVPMEGLLRGLIDFFDLPMSTFTAGPEAQPPLRAGGYRVAPFICYEVVYPDLVAQGASHAELLVTISNDSWFGDSIGPLQHLQMAQMRALENGRYMIRATNNGVSAIIDHRGQIIARTPQFIATTLHGKVELMLGDTAFSSFGSTPVIIGCFITIMLMALMYLVFWRDTD